MMPGARPYSILVTVSANVPTLLAKPDRPHRILVPSLLAVATVLGFFACFAVWVNRQALSTDNWTNTSSRVLEDPHVQEALSTYLVAELFTSINVQEKLRTELPSELKGLSGPLTAGLRQIADRAVPKLLATSRVQATWRRANQVAHRELLTIINGGGKVVSTERGVVALNVHELVTELGKQLGLSSQVETVRGKLSGSSGAAVRGAAQEKLGLTLPASSGRIVIMRANQLSTAQNIAKAIKGLAILLPLLALAMFALAVSLATGWRRFALRSTGWCFFGVGVALLLARRVAGNAIVNGLVANPANKPAGEAIWSIGTSLLYDIAVAMVLYGLVLVAAAWLAGSTRPAMFLRRAGAPWLQAHVAGSYAAAGVVLLLVVFWGPTPATRQLLPVLGFAALAALGVAELRRQTAAEFPDAVPGEAMAQLRASWPFSRNRREPPASAEGQPTRPAAVDPNGQPVTESERPAASGRDPAEPA